MRPVIEIENLTKYYGKHRGIEHLNLVVDEGEFFGFIGPNGAGKSTTIRTILGLLRPQEGSVRILGRELGAGGGSKSGAGREKIRKGLLREIGYMPSEAFFYSWMKVEDVLKFSASFYDRDCSEECGRLCERLKLDTRKKVDELSLGNRKKVSIVCALQHGAKLYVLDEPTSGLDPLMQREFFEILKERNESGASVFLSSHVLGEVERYCHRAAIIREGSIIAVDSVDNIRRSSARKVTVRGVSELPGIFMEKAEILDDGVRFFYRGEMEKLIGALQGLPIRDLTITEPDLEEVFLHFYEGESR